MKAVAEAYEAKVESIGAPVMRHLEKALMLQQLDTQVKACAHREGLLILFTQMDIVNEAIG